MTTDYHTPHVFGAPLSSSEVNGPLAELDAAIGGALTRMGSAEVILGPSYTFSAGDIHVNGIAYDGHTLLAGTYAVWAGSTIVSVWASSDKGLTWSKIAPPAGASGTEECVSIAAIQPGVFLMVCSVPSDGTVVYRSTDSGQTWLKMQAFTDAHGYFLSQQNGASRALLMGGGEVTVGSPRIYRSTDSGEQWTQVKETTSTGATSVIRQIVMVADGIFVAGAYGSSPNQTDIWRSTDNGVTWTNIQTLASTDVYAIISLGDGVVLLGTHPDGKVYRSTDSGATFSLNSTYGSAGSSSVMSFTQLGNKVVMMTNEGATNRYAYVSLDAGLTWAAAGSLTAGYHVHMAVAVDDSTLVGIETDSSNPSRSRRFVYHG